MSQASSKWTIENVCGSLVLTNQLKTNVKSGEGKRGREKQQREREEKNNRKRGTVITERKRRE
jgi:hypothetical protein